MDAREAGRRAARRWTGLLSALGIGLTGVLGFATYHAIEAGKTAPASTSTTDGGSGDGSTGSGDATAPDQGFSQDDGSAPQDDGNGFSQGFGPGSGPAQTGSSGS